MILRTERTVLRPWRPSDLPAFERLCADPRVMRYFPRTLPPEMADALARRLIDEMERNGFGAWALEIPGEADFAGFVGLGIPSRPGTFEKFRAFASLLHPSRRGG